MNVRAEKDAMRRRLRARRAALGATEREAAAKALAAAVSTHPLVQRLSKGPVLVPVGHRSEVATELLAERLEAQGWDLVRPRADPQHTHLDAVPWPRDQPLVPGYAGILEPPQEAPMLDPRRLRLILVPGLAFARDGHRLGSGLGFFDRFLAPLRSADAPPVTIGIGYGMQLVDKVPHESHDIPLDGLQLEGDAIVCRP